MLIRIILLLLSKKQVYVPLRHFISKRQSKTIKPFCKRFERSVYWNEHKTKSENKDTENKDTSIDVFSNQML